MHNSQNGSSVALVGTVGWDGTTLQGNPSDTPNDQLLVSGCVGCHTATNSETIIDIGNGTRIPIVFNTNGYPDYPLAGGNFYWISMGGSENDQRGHNVEDISGEDENLDIVPGVQIGSNDQLSISDCLGCHIPFLVGNPGIPFVKSRAGNFLICEDCHLEPRHHADDSETVVDDTGGWYRFLYRVKGIEESNWEQNPTSTVHNEYQGETSSFQYSISDSGCACHGQFHALKAPSKVGTDSPWFKHPTDVALPSDTDKEYHNYTVYNPQAPVARPDLSGYTSASDEVTPGTDQVMCLSCHRPHGSPYPDILRWNYDFMIAGGGSGSDGCFICHSNKDDS